jgi:hypothetical protein
MTTVEVTLDADLYESLKNATAEEGTSPESVLNDLTRQYLRAVRRRKIEAESEAYQAMHSQLKQEYFGEHVAIHNGQLVDHDADVNELIRRVRARYGHEPVMITQVEEQPIREYVIHSMRLVPPNQ